MAQCKKCKKDFVNNFSVVVCNTTTGQTWRAPIERYKLCPDCRGSIGKTPADTYAYTKKGYGYRLIAGFNLMHASDKN